MRHFAIFLLVYACDYVHAVIYECTDDSGQKTFTDQGCPSHSRIYPLAQEAPLIFAPLQDSERERLRELAATAAKSRRLAQSNRQRSRAAQARQSSQKSAACAEALAALDALESLRRKGYPLAKQAQLDQTGRDLKAKKQANC